MSLIHYISSPRPLPLGEFCSNKNIKNTNSETKLIKFSKSQSYIGTIPLDKIIDLSSINEGEIETFESYKDVAGIFVENLDLQRESIKKHFKNQYIYQLIANWGAFYISENLKIQNIESFNVNKECILKLFEFIRVNSIDGEQFEIYSSWVGEEEMPKKSESIKIINLKSLEIKDIFELEDKEYIIINI